MPAMRRFNKKATKIAYKILGTPANILAKRTYEQKRLNRRLVSEETVRVR